MNFSDFMMTFNVTDGALNLTNTAENESPASASAQHPPLPPWIAEMHRNGKQNAVVYVAVVLTVYLVSISILLLKSWRDGQWTQHQYNNGHLRRERPNRRNQQNTKNKSSTAKKATNANSGRSQRKKGPFRTRQQQQQQHENTPQTAAQFLGKIPGKSSIFHGRGAATSLLSNKKANMACSSKMGSGLCNSSCQQLVSVDEHSLPDGRSNLYNDPAAAAGGSMGQIITAAAAIRDNATLFRINQVDRNSPPCWPIHHHGSAPSLEGATETFTEEQETTFCLATNENGGRQCSSSSLLMVTSVDDTRLLQTQAVTTKLCNVYQQKPPSVVLSVKAEIESQNKNENQPDIPFETSFTSLNG